VVSSTLGEQQAAIERLAFSLQMGISGMDDSHTNRRALEDLWRSRLTDAQIRHDFARNHREEVARDLLVGHIPDGNGAFAYREALLAEKMALVEYQRVLDIFTALVVGGKIPEEMDWPRSKEDDEG
jgi:hypothetical protein